MTRTQLVSYAVAVCCLAIVPLQVLAQVEYELTFESTWTSTTHPVDFPANAHFSGLFGATHDDSFTLWETGGLATIGVKNVAETGSGSAILSEIAGGGAAVFDEVRLAGIDTPDSASSTFEAQASHSLVSFVTMIAPSPDWIVGVHDIDLRPNGIWVSELVFDALPYDAGTDSGLSYRSANQATRPVETIHRLTGGVLEGTPGFGTFTIRRLTELPDADFDDDGMLGLADIDLLGDEIGRGDDPADFDLTGDGAVDLEDRDAWLAAAAVPLGDLNLDRVVDSTDLGLLLNQFLGVETTYSTGDLNADWMLDSTDLGLLLNNFGASTIEAVPEPASAWLMIMAFFCIAASRGRSIAE